jgi:antitoxin YefM
MKETSYTDARDRLAQLLDEVEDDREVYLIRRRGHEDVALVAASELSSLLETAHLLRSPANAQRLLAALRSALRRTTKPSSVTSLRKQLRLT